MIVSPQGKIIAEAQGPDSLAVADINPFGGREGGDAMNYQRDMRARLFRERNPAAFSVLVEPEPPVLAKLPATITEQEAVRIARRVLTIGEEEFHEAAELSSRGKTAEAIAAFTRLASEYPNSWIDRVSAERLAKLHSQSAKAVAPGLAASYPADVGIERDPQVIFVEDFEKPSLDALTQRWEDVSHPEIMSLSADVPAGSGGRQSLLLTHIGGKGNGGHLYRRLPKGQDGSMPASM